MMFDTRDGQPLKPYLKWCKLLSLSGTIHKSVNTMCLTGVHFQKVSGSKLFLKFQTTGTRKRIMHSTKGNVCCAP